jgi:hypothetical protein
MLSAKELKQAFYDLIKYPMSIEEVNTINELLRTRFKKGELKKLNYKVLFKQNLKDNMT